jgi:uncharacterized Tic20 family protein
MQNGDLVAPVSFDGQQSKNTDGYRVLYIIILVALSMLLILVVGLAVAMAAYVQDITPLIAAMIISLVIISLMVACVFIFRKRKRPT